MCRVLIDFGGIAMSDKMSYESPLASRYASREMLYLFSPQKKFSTWRRLWVALARAEMKLGLPITQEQIDEMEAHINDIDFELAAVKEKELRHDVMAHVHTFGTACPKAMPIIHLGATSCYVTDNTDIIILREGLEIIRDKLVALIAKLSDFAMEHRALPTLGFTHFQPAQLTTVGKRASLWIYDLLMDIENLEQRIASLKLLGSKGTTGTQASFMALFNDDQAKIKEMERLIAEEMGFDAVVPVSGQTYSRKIDYYAIAALSAVAQSAGKFATDMRLLSHLKELEEPFEGKQIGSSAMPYKRNPMRCERICSLARYVMADTMNPAMTAYNQWLERTLDDSANRRISIAEAFLAVDSILNIYLNVADGIKVYPKVIEKHVMEELPFMATENIMMRAVKNGGNRQELHERIRIHSIAAGAVIKEEGKPNDLISRIAADPLFGMTEEEIRAELSPVEYTGRAADQVVELIENFVKPVLKKYPEAVGKTAELKV